MDCLAIFWFTSVRCSSYNRIDEVSADYNETRPDSTEYLLYSMHCVHWLISATILATKGKHGTVTRSTKFNHRKS